MANKRIAKIYLILAASVACIVGLACLFSEKTARGDEGGDVRHHARSGRGAVARGSGKLSVAARASQARENSGPQDGFASLNSKSQLTDPPGALDESTALAANQTDEEAPTPATIAMRKETLMRERFGVIFRQDKWIPTAGGGTNLVYITTGSLPPSRVGEVYNVQFQATSGFPPYLWRIVDGELPPSFAFDGPSGKLSGTAVEPITANFFLEVTDSKGARDVAEYVLIVQPERALEIVTESLPAALPGTNYFCQLQAIGGIPPYIWSGAGNLNEIGILVLDSQTGQIHGEISAAIPEVDVPLIFCLSDAQLRISKELVLHVAATLRILEIQPISTHVADQFELTLQATGGAEPYIWGVSGTLPPGLEFSTDGLCSGQPSEPGTYEINIWAQDTAGLFDTVQIALEVLPSPDAVSDFAALLSRNSVALNWKLPATSGDIGVLIVRGAAATPLTPLDGVTVYHGSETSCLDRDVGKGRHYYAAFLEKNGTTVTSASPSIICASLPPEIDPFADKVVSKNLLHPNAFRALDLPQIVLGAPRGKGLAWGSTDVLSLGAAINDDGGATAPYGGTITLEFVDNAVWDGPGVDFTIFENVFYICDASDVPDPETRFMEPAVVSVSQDGVNWRQFKFDFSPRYDPASGILNLRHPYCYNSGFAGVNPVMSNGYDPDPTDPALSGGDSFDLADVGLDWIRYVCIQSTGSRWLIDHDGDLVYHNEETDAATRSNNKSGFDLDAVTAIWMTKLSAAGDINGKCP